MLNSHSDLVHLKNVINNKVSHTIVECRLIDHHQIPGHLTIQYLLHSTCYLTRSYVVAGLRCQFSVTTRLITYYEIHVWQFMITRSSGKINNGLQK